MIFLISFRNKNYVFKSVYITIINPHFFECEVKGNKTPSHSFDYWAVAKIFMDMKQARSDKTFWQKSGPQKLQGAFPGWHIFENI